MSSTERPVVSLYDGMNKIPGGLREGGLLTEEEIARLDQMDLGISEPKL